MTSAKINMKSGRGNNEKLYGVTAHKRRKQLYLKVELIKTSTTIRHYIIISDVAWIWKLEFILKEYKFRDLPEKSRTCTVGWYQALHKRDWVGGYVVILL